MNYFIIEEYFTACDVVEIQNKNLCWACHVSQQQNKV